MDIEIFQDNICSGEKIGLIQDIEIYFNFIHKIRFKILSKYGNGLSFLKYMIL